MIVECLKKTPSCSSVSRIPAAARWPRDLLRKGIKATSAGTFPASQISSLVVQAMKEREIDISSAKPKPITEQMVEEAKVVVLTDAPLEELLPKNIRKKIGKKLVTWSISDSQGQPIEVVRFIRDGIEKSLNSLLAKEGTKS